MENYLQKILMNIKKIVALEDGRFWRLAFAIILLLVARLIIHKFVILPDNFPDKSLIGGVAFCASWGFVGLAFRAFYIIYELMIVQNKKDTGNDSKYKKFIDYLVIRPIFVLIGSLIIFSILDIYIAPNSQLFYTLSIPLNIILGFYTTELFFRLPHLISR